MIETTEAHFSPDKVDGVIFDIGGVFLYPHFSPVRSLQIVLGLEVPEELESYRRAHHAGCRALAEGTRAPAEHDHDFWLDYDRAYTASLGIPDQHLASFRSAVRTRWDWPHDANIASFHRLAETGRPLAIVSNNDGSAEESMQTFGVCQVGPGPLPSVAIVVDSALAGVAKPDPAIMTPALDLLGLAAERTLYVGDTVHADVVGATRAGMQVVQLDPYDHHRDYPHPRVSDLAELLDRLS